jgi:septum formation topological specificity factor MinE
LKEGGEEGFQAEFTEKEEESMSMKEIQEKLVATLKRWQKVEDEAVLSIGEFVDTIMNPLPRAVFEIIKQDAGNHRRVQELIIQADERKGFQLKVEELEELSKVISRHIQVEKRMIQAAEKSLQAIQGKKMILHEYFLKYLSQDEKKHKNLLEGLQKIKRHMYPYGPSA